MEWLKANKKWVLLGIVIVAALFFADGSPVFFEGQK